MWTLPNTDTKQRSIVIAGVVGSLVLALSLNSTVSSILASIVNDTNTAGTSTLVMQETNDDGSVVCLSTDGGSINTNSATCSTINKYGGNLAMASGQTVTTTIKIKNTGTATANTFSLTPGACTQSANGATNGSATDLCSKINLVITSGATTVFSGTATSLAAGGAINTLGPVSAGQEVPFDFAVTLDSSTDNTYQGLKVAQQLTWTFGA